MPEKLRIAEARRTEAIGREVVLQGWVRTRRDSKAGFSFLELNDGSCFGNIQVIAESSLDNYESEIKHLTAGSSVSVTGLVRESPGKGQATEVQATCVVVHGMADAETYPLQKKHHSMEFLRTIAHLRPRTNTFGAVARVRNAACHAIHQFFQDEGFLYLHTPVITASDCEGAGAMFQVTTLDLANPPKVDAATGAAIDFTQDFFDRPAFLTVSGQLEAETFACGLGRAYTFGPTFRAENSNTARHLAEFWMVEPEMAFFDLADNMDLAERFLKRVIGDVLARCPDDMEFFNQRIDGPLSHRERARVRAEDIDSPLSHRERARVRAEDVESCNQQGDPTVIETLRHVVDTPFVRLSYTEAVEILTASGEPFEFPVAWGTDLQAEHERYLTERHFAAPVILSDYPRTIKPFYMRVSDDGRTVAAMDVLVPRVGEIIGGSQREERLDVLRERMAEQGLDAESYWWYLDLRRYGTVPHSGFGLGLERLIQFITGMANIRDVIPFPRTPGSAEF